MNSAGSQGKKNSITTKERTLTSSLRQQVQSLQENLVVCQQIAHIWCIFFIDQWLHLSSVISVRLNKQLKKPEPEFANLLRSPGINYQPGAIGLILCSSNKFDAETTMSSLIFLYCYVVLWKADEIETEKRSGLFRSKYPWCIDKKVASACVCWRVAISVICASWNYSFYDYWLEDCKKCRRWCRCENLVWFCYEVTRIVCRK